MPVNGIELKEGQKWKTLSGRVATLEDNPREEPYVFRAVYKDGYWNTVTKDGKSWTDDYDSFLRELIYDPEQTAKSYEERAKQLREGLKAEMEKSGVKKWETIIS